jgi:O-antigen/teichoic acid export membrane protein
MAPGIFFGKFNIITNWAFISLGHVDRQLRWGFILAIPTILGYVIGIHWGPIGVAAAMSIITCGLRIPGIIYCFYNTHLKLRDVWQAAWLASLASISAGFALWGCHVLMPLATSGRVQFLIDLVLYGVFYLSVWLMLPNGRGSLLDLVQLIQQLRFQPSASSAARKKGQNVNDKDPEQPPS